MVRQPHAIRTRRSRAAAMGSTVVQGRSSASVKDAWTTENDEELCRFCNLSISFPTTINTSSIYFINISCVLVFHDKCFSPVTCSITRKSENERS